ncbi:LLM class flavin-dependent oxidoreductase [Bradyrhizobium sp. USDA 4504]
MAISYLTDMRDIGGRAPTAQHYDEQVKMAKFAEELGYKTVFVAQNHASDDGFCPAPLAVLAAMARETKRIRLGTGIIQLPLTQFRRVVEEACVVDTLSNGRLTLGVGLGQYESEFKAFERSLKDRSKLMEDGLTFLRHSFSGEPLPDGLPLSVPPVQRPVPVVVGSYLARPTERAVRLADGQFMTCHMDQESDLGRRWKEIVSPALQKYGRSPDNFQLLLMSVIWASDNHKDDWRDFVEPAYLYRYNKSGSLFDKQKLPQLYDVLDSAKAQGPDGMRNRMLVDAPSKVAARLKKVREVYPFNEFIIYKLNGIPHDQFAKFLQTFREQVAPVVFPERKW